MVDIRRYASMLAALGHEVRLAIVRLLLARPEGLVVGEIQKEIPIPSSTLSHHLDILLRAGLVEQRREGRFLRYRGSEEGFRALVSFLSEGAAPTAPRRRSAFGD